MSSYFSSIETKRFAQRVNEMGADTGCPGFRGVPGRVKAPVDYGWRRARKSDRVKTALDILEKYHPGWAAMGMGKPVRWLTKLLLR